MPSGSSSYGKKKGTRKMPKTSTKKTKGSKKKNDTNI